MLIALHLGAHKTASTYVQEAMQQSCCSLRGVGVAYMPLSYVRSNITDRLNFGAFRLGAAVRRLIEKHGACERLVLSDENILGGLKPSRRTGAFYPSCGRRAAALAREFSPNELEIFLSIRSYDAFISAMYSEYIRHNRFISSDAYLALLDLRLINWSDTIARLVDVVGARNLTLWRYEDFEQMEDEVFSAITGGHGKLVKRPDRKLRESLTGEAVATLSKQPPWLTRNEIRSRSKRIAAAFPKGPGRPAFSAFSADQVETLRARYENETRLVPTRFPEVKMLTPRASLAAQ